MHSCAPVAPRITCRWVFLGMLAAALGCGFLCEQPHTSIIQTYAWTNRIVRVETVTTLCNNIVCLYMAN